MKSTQNLLSAKQIAERLSISVRLAQRLMQEMNPVNVSAGNKQKAWRVLPEELEKWIVRRAKQEADADSGTPELTLIRPRKKRKAAMNGAYPRPVNGKIPNRSAGGGGR